jgi:hypothetical protein
VTFKEEGVEVSSACSGDGVVKRKEVGDGERIMDSEGSEEEEDDE